MKVCAITMVYRDYWALSQWYAHYSRHLGSAQLYIVSHGSDAKVIELCPGANVITVPRDTLAGFDQKRGELLNSLQDSLGVSYDWVIRTDVDELICLDPNEYTSFEALFASRLGSSIFALGLDVVETKSDRPLVQSDRCLAQRRNVLFSGHYSKAWAVMRGTHLMRHGVCGKDSQLFDMPAGVYLAHLKYASADALEAVNSDRIDVASGSESGLPGLAWSDATQDANKFLSRFNALSIVDWETASDTAYNTLVSDPVVDVKAKVVRSRSVHFDHRTQLPDWFKYC